MANNKSNIDRAREHLINLGYEGEEVDNIIKKYSFEEKMKNGETKQRIKKDKLEELQQTYKSQKNIVENTAEQIVAEEATKQKFTPVSGEKYRLDRRKQKNLNQIKDIDLSLFDGDIPTDNEKLIENFYNTRDLKVANEFIDITRNELGVNKKVRDLSNQIETMTFERNVKAPHSQTIKQIIEEDGQKSIIEKTIDSNKGTFEERIKNLSSGRKYSKTIKQANNATKEAVREVEEKLTKETAKEAAEKGLKGLMHSPLGRLAAGVGVTAFIVSNMNKSKGQQTNAQLYGQQQTPYQY